jgi:hypothetical protein
LPARRFDPCNPCRRLAECQRVTTRTPPVACCQRYSCHADRVPTALRACNSRAQRAATAASRVCQQQTALVPAPQGSTAPPAPRPPRRRRAANLPCIALRARRAQRPCRAGTSLWAAQRTGAPARMSRCVRRARGAPAVCSWSVRRGHMGLHLGLRAQRAPEYALTDLSAPPAAQCLPRSSARLGSGALMVPSFRAPAAPTTRRCRRVRCPTARCAPQTLTRVR